MLHLRKSAAQRVAAAPQDHAAVTCQGWLVHGQGMSREDCGAAAWLHLWAAAGLQPVEPLWCPTDNQQVLKCEAELDMMRW